MILAIKIRLKPTKEQELLFWKSAGVARWSYNYHLGRNKEEYSKGGKYLNNNIIRKEVTQLKKSEEFKWLKEVGSNVVKQAIKDADKAYLDFFKGKSGFPKFKSKNRSKPSFYVNYESLSKKMNGFQGEKIGYVKTCKNLPNLINGQKYYSNPRISYDGKHWYLSVGLEVEEKQVELTDTVLGIDLGIKNLAICSNEVVYKNINKTKEVRRLEKKLKREQRKLSRRLENNIDHYIKVLGKDGNYHNKPIYKKEINDCKNIKKQRLKIKNLYQRLTNIRNNHLHQSTREIINTLPKAIVLETLNVKGMMKNRHLAKSIANQKFYEFKRQIDYKAKMVGIEVVYADKFYPSSRMCSCCGNIKKDLKLSDRIYKCECGLDIDRDKNASINLANYYKLA